MLFLGNKKNNKTDIRTSKLFVLINCIEGKISHTMDKIEKVDFVTDIQQIDGPYDIIVTLESQSHHDLKKALTHQIRSIDTVGGTLTLRSSPDDIISG